MSTKPAALKARFNLFWVRFKRCWALLWDPAAFDAFDRWEARRQTIEALLQSPTAVMLDRSVEKTARDRSFHPTKDHELKRREALEWAGHYAHDAGIVLGSQWERDFILAWIIGIRKGRF